MSLYSARAAAVSCLLLMTFPTKAAEQLPSQNALRVSVQEVGRHYCKDSSVLDILELNLKFNYTNGGSSALLLPRRFYITGIAVKSGDKIDYHLGNIEHNNVPTDFFGDLPGPEFLALEPGETVRMFDTVGIFIQRGDSPLATTPGLRTMELTVSPILPRSKALEARTKWQALGSLWIEGVTAQPLQLRIDDIHPSVACTN